MSSLYRPIKLVLFASLAVLAACASPAAEPARAAPPVVGSDRDAHGCKASAGYTWCAREQACVRPWELAREKGFERGDEAFERYCRAPAREP